MDFFGFLTGEGDTAAKNAVDQTVGTNVFKSSLLELLPETYTPEQKEEFYNDLVKKEYIVQTTGKGVIIRGMLRIDSIIDTKPNSLHI